MGNGCLMITVGSGSGSPTFHLGKTGFRRDKGKDKDGAGWLYPERNLKKNPISEEEKAMLRRATSNKDYHYFGEGRFLILLGRSSADAMQELMGAGI